MSAEELFSTEQRKEIEKIIAQAEDKTSGEIRLFIESECKADVLDRAAHVFHQLKMHETNLRNGVLFYLAMNSHKFAILGDAGINAKVPKDFWNEIKQAMQNHFVKGEFSEGLIRGITMAGDALQKHFPCQRDDKDELPDEIVFGK